jgi:hypothetical protein
MKRLKSTIKLAVALFVLAFACPAGLADAQESNPALDRAYRGDDRAETDAALGAQAVIDSTHDSQNTVLPTPQAPESLLTLDNGTIKVSVDTLYGGAITYLSQSGSTTNLINDYDHGRQVQQSYYSGPANFVPPGAIQNPNWSPFPWNPVQAGDSYDYPSQVFAYSNANGVIYIKTRPKQWALQNYNADCIMENGHISTALRFGSIANSRTSVPIIRNTPLTAKNCRLYTVWDPYVTFSVTLVLPRSQVVRSHNCEMPRRLSGLHGVPLRTGAQW